MRLSSQEILGEQDRRRQLSSCDPVSRSVTVAPGRISISYSPFLHSGAVDRMGSSGMLTLVVRS